MPHRWSSMSAMTAQSTVPCPTGGCSDVRVRASRIIASASASGRGATSTPPVAPTESTRPGASYAMLVVPTFAASDTTRPQPSRTDVTEQRVRRARRARRVLRAKTRPRISTPAPVRACAGARVLLGPDPMTQSRGPGVRRAPVRTRRARRPAASWKTGDRRTRTSECLPWGRTAPVRDRSLGATRRRA